MAWNPFRKTDEPDKKDDQSKSEIDTLVEKLGVSFDERIKPLREGFEKLQGEWDGIKAAATKEPDSNGGGDGTRPTIPSVSENEDAAFAARLGPVVALNIQTNARLTEREILDEISPNWSHLIPEIRGYFSSPPLSRKAQADYPDFCRNIKDMVVGKAAQKAGLRFDKKNERFFLEDATAKTGGEDSPLADPDLSWTDGTGKLISGSETLARLGIKPEEFVENQKKGYV